MTQNLFLHGVELNDNNAKKMDKIFESLKAFCPNSNVKVRLLRANSMYEALVWGELNYNPIGIYKRHICLDTLLEKLKQKMFKECKLAAKNLVPEKAWGQGVPMELAG